MSATHKKLNVVQTLGYFAGCDRLQGDLRTVSVVNAIMAPLKDRLKHLLELLERLVPRFGLVRRGQFTVLRRSDAEQAGFCVPVKHPRFDCVLIQQLPTLGEEMVE